MCTLVLAVCEVGQVQACVYTFFLQFVRLDRFKHVYTWFASL